MSGPINQRVKSQFCIADNLYSGRNIIKIKDFAVRRSTFMCVNKQHFIQDIEAVFKIIDKNANIHEETVSAGFCPYCNIYFIMESTYQELRKKEL